MSVMTLHQQDLLLPEARPYGTELFGFTLDGPGTARKQPAQEKEEKKEHEDDKVDEASDESFPASDPPPWTS